MAPDLRRAQPVESRWSNRNRDLRRPQRSRFCFRIQVPGWVTTYDACLFNSRYFGLRPYMAMYPVAINESPGMRAIHSNGRLIKYAKRGPSEMKGPPTICTL